MIKIHATGSSGNFYSLETSTEILILEAGINIKKIKEALDFDLSKVVGCLITHEHKDHSKSVKEVLKCGIDVYMSEGTLKGINLDYDYSHRIPYLLEHNSISKIGGFTVVPFNTQHDVNEPLGFLIHHPELGKILFATDTYYLKNRFNNVDHILIECNYSEDVILQLPAWRARTLKSHMSLETLKETLNSWDLTGVKDIILIHISHDNGEPDRFQKEIQELTGIKTYIGEPGLILE
ncbi:MBL fold metallo-hydrolase [Clostridium beijerinckii]|uniref:MBL fold metallo-hydrolase n=1 Tax=Clostridium beijerinckii TaxID=1520 RepID=UPI001360CBED|nr:MBL fold metallo-hydrolase [Clostridium beijerinckii]MZK53324.1 MBL fold metallo-hydrolase [Clostridium beijerinckii]MZK61429.1 MBL fold metallo-hydrolase [Clostridium beijerinckii]MZK71671.1 MBL fold metallo-hydrolase [Clostridium beijerinckii]MZK77064.1 MBL fold metallo-hydrolase [Clostridium beijerinckii]MZK86719.1 MBL fold metallo-hydrolase [Clostridium beijerinckii]